MFQAFTKRRQSAAAVRDLYTAIVLQARDPAFYGSLGVPDTVDGRFDLITLHVMLVLRRLRGQGQPAEIRGQELFDLMFKDMDQSLRELGVGDMGVGKHIKRMANAFYGRAESYEAGLDAALLDNKGADNTQVAPRMTEALTENLFRATAATAPLAVMQNYMLRADRHISTQNLEDILAGRIDMKVPVIEATSGFKP